MFKVNYKDTRTALILSLLLTWNIFHTLRYSVSIADFEQVIIGWIIGMIYRNHGRN